MRYKSCWHNMKFYARKLPTFEPWPRVWDKDRKILSKDKLTNNHPFLCARSHIFHGIPWSDLHVSLTWIFSKVAEKRITLQELQEGKEKTEGAKGGNFYQTNDFILTIIDIHVNKYMSYIILNNYCKHQQHVEISIGKTFEAYYRKQILHKARHFNWRCLLLFYTLITLLVLLLDIP